MRVARQTDLFVSTEDILAPILAVVVAAVLGLGYLHFSASFATSSAAKNNPNFAASLATKTKLYSHNAHG